MKNIFFAVVCLAMISGCTHSGPRKPSSTGDVGSVDVLSGVAEGASGRSRPEVMDSRNFLCGVDAAQALRSEIEMDGLEIIATSFPVADASSRGVNSLVKWVMYGVNAAGTKQRVLAVVFEQPQQLGSTCKFVAKEVKASKK